MQSADYIVIGGGIAGISVAARLVERAPAPKVLVLERESHPGTHATGRSAANWEPTFGTPAIRALTRASGPFYVAPPPGFADAPLVATRTQLLAARAGEDALLEPFLAAGYREISPAEAHRRHPAIRAGAYARFLLDATCADVDVDLLLQGFLRQLRAAGGALVPKAEVTAGERRGGLWHLTTTQGAFAAPVIINAAGAWADVVAKCCGIAPIGLVPKRRSAAIVAGTGMDGCSAWPQIAPADDSFYAKPMGGRLMLSPADADPMEPHDAWADDYKLAEAVEGLMGLLTVEVTRLERTWGGLRSFVADGDPVVGFATPHGDSDGFFWLAAQGGYGIQTAPALAALAAAALLNLPMPAFIAAEGVTFGTVSPARLTATASR